MIKNHLSKLESRLEKLESPPVLSPVTLNKQSSRQSLSMSPSECLPKSVTEQKENATPPLCKTLQVLKAQKDSKPLPPISRSALVPPQSVVEQNPKLLFASKIPTLSVKLAKESYFTKDIMVLCTVRGVGSFHALPETELQKLRAFLQNVYVSRQIGTKLEFESVWKNCTEAIGQACKALRRARS